MTGPDVGDLCGAPGARGAVGALLYAKGRSDRKDYGAKHRTLRCLLDRSPEDFHINSHQGAFVGLTHTSGFRIHMPRRYVPDGLVDRSRDKEAESMEGRKQAKVEFETAPALDDPRRRDVALFGGPYRPGGAWTRTAPGALGGASEEETDRAPHEHRSFAAVKHGALGRLFGKKPPIDEGEDADEDGQEIFLAPYKETGIYHLPPPPPDHPASVAMNRLAHEYGEWTRSRPHTSTDSGPVIAVSRLGLPREHPLALAQRDAAYAMTHYRLGALNAIPPENPEERPDPVLVSPEPGGWRRYEYKHLVDDYPRYPPKGHPAREAVDRLVSTYDDWQRPRLRPGQVVSKAYFASLPEGHADADPLRHVDPREFPLDHPVRRAYDHALELMAEYKFGKPLASRFVEGVSRRMKQAAGGGGLGNTGMALVSGGGSGRSWSALRRHRHAAGRFGHTHPRKPTYLSHDTQIVEGDAEPLERPDDLVRALRGKRRSVSSPDLYGLATSGKSASWSVGSSVVPQALIGAGAGLAGATLAGGVANLLAPGLFDTRKMRRHAALAGAALGGLAIPAYRYSLAYRTPGSPGKGDGWKALWTKWPEPGTGVSDEVPVVAPEMVRTAAASPSLAVLAVLKAAAAAAAGRGGESGLYVPDIPVDAFNNAVWLDTHATPNPFGTRSPMGDAHAPLTPPSTAQAVTRTVATAGRMTGSGRVSPYAVGQAAILGGGAGWAGGMLLGRVVGSLAGLSEAGQRAAMRTGFWAGALTGAANAAYGR